MPAANAAMMRPEPQDLPRCAQQQQALTGRRACVASIAHEKYWEGCNHLYVPANRERRGQDRSLWSRLCKPFPIAVAS